MPLIDLVKETEKRYLIVKDGDIRGDVCFGAGLWHVNIIGVAKLAYKHNKMRQAFGYAYGVFAAANVIGTEIHGDRTPGAGA